jgi:DNA polymerase-3 subunit beta
MSGATTNHERKDQAMNEAAITLASKDFRHAVSLTRRAVSGRSNIPILSTVHCRANGSFEASGTDLDVMITARVDHGGGPKAEFILAEPGAVVSALKVSGAETLQLSQEDRKLGLSSGALSMTIASYPADDFPSSAINMAAEQFTASFSHDQLRSLARVASAISTEETRYYLNGIHIHALEEGGYRAVATDGHRLCWIDLALPDAVGDLGGIILPRRALALILQLAGSPSKEDAGARITVGSSNIPNRETSTAPERATGATRARMEIQSGAAAVTLATKLIDGTFPDYRRVIPTNGDKSFLFKTAGLRRAVEAASFGSTKLRAIKLDFDDQGARVSTHYTDTGVDTAVRLPCEHRHAGFSVGFNGGYLMAMLSASRGDEFILTTESESAPALCRNPTDTEWGGVLMPMRV